MSEYLRWNQKTITDFSEKNINSLYNEGYVFTRLGLGVLDQTRSLRIDLSQFELTSENRRILRKTEKMTATVVPLPYHAYDWAIGKMGKKFYDTKFGKGVMTANKIKELLTDPKKSNFNRVFVYTNKKETIGYTIALETLEFIHYSYPFYIKQEDMPNVGLGMMLKAVLWAKKTGKKYIYLGSAQRVSDTYKLQFVGVAWFDGNAWETNIEKLKSSLLLKKDG